MFGMFGVLTFVCFSRRLTRAPLHQDGLLYPNPLLRPFIGLIMGTIRLNRPSSAGHVAIARHF